MLQLRMQSHPIRLEYSIQNAQLQRNTTLPKMEMETIPVRLEIRQPWGELTIDSTAFYNSIGKKTISALSRDHAQAGKQAALEAIATIVDNGNSLALIQNPGNIIADLAFESQLEKTGELSWEPIAKPEISYKASPVQIEVIPGKVNYTPHNAIIDSKYVPGKVDIQVSQYPRLEISVIDVKV